MSRFVKFKVFRVLRNQSKTEETVDVTINCDKIDFYGETEVNGKKVVLVSISGQQFEIDENLESFEKSVIGRPLLKG